MNTTRRDFLQSSLAASALALTAPHLYAETDPIAPYRTPYKYPDLILKATGNKSDFDRRASTIP